jgi:hypothetical protein
MPGPMGKPAATRQRRNKASTFTVLTQPGAGEIKVPRLPKRDDGPWHRMTLRWWLDIWDSPMAPEYDESDIHGLFALAMVVNDFWTAQTAKDRQAASSEIRLMSQRYGLSPMDRRRLQWQISETESKQRSNARGAAREADNSPAPAQRPGWDPRKALSA